MGGEMFIFYTELVKNEKKISIHIILLILLCFVAKPNNIKIPHCITFNYKFITQPHAYFIIRIQCNIQNQPYTYGNGIEPQVCS